MKDIKLDLMDAALAFHKLLNDAEHHIRHLEYDDKINKNCLLQMQEVAKETIRMVKDLTNLVDAQGQKGTWDISPYHTGLFNGLELALSIFEKREPKYRDHPDRVSGFGQKPTKHLDDVLGASEYIVGRGKIFQDKYSSVSQEVKHECS